MPVTDYFENHAAGTSDPASSAREIVPDDNMDLPFRPRSIYVAYGGDLRVQLDHGPVTFQNLPGGALLPIRPTRVYADSTTCTGLIAIW